MNPSPVRVAARWLQATRSPAESAAISLLQDDPDASLAELLRMVERAGMMFDPVSRQMVKPEDVAAALKRLAPKPYSVSGGIQVYHATEPSTAKMLVKRGFIPATKPRSQVDSYAPGRGIDEGLYVGHSARAVESYGRVVLEITVPRKALAVPTELAQLGETDPMKALRTHDGAIIPTAIPAEAFRVVEGHRYLLAGDANAHTR